MVTLRVPAVAFDVITVDLRRGNISVDDLTRAHVASAGRVHLELHTAHGHIQHSYAADRTRGCALVNGSVTVTTRPVPAACSLSSISPPSSSTMRPTMERPRPLPPAALPGMR